MNRQEMSVSADLRSSNRFSGTAAVVAPTSRVAAHHLAQLPLNCFQRYSMVAARVLIATIFMMTALNIIGQGFAAHQLAANGVPPNLVPILVMAARALQLVAGLGLILGLYPRISALALLLFLIPATLVGHAFWLAIGTSLYPIQLINFFKNVCMAGGLIFIIATTSQPVLLPRPVRADSNPLA
jgi:putative oxidoreductase